VLPGFAWTVAPVVVSKPVDGDQPYVEAPAAVSVTEAPLQILVESPGVVVTVGSGFTVTVTLPFMLSVHAVVELLARTA
jgi:hypothetical protein